MRAWMWLFLTGCAISFYGWIWTWSFRHGGWHADPWRYQGRDGTLTASGWLMCVAMLFGPFLLLLGLVCGVGGWLRGDKRRGSA